MQKTYNVVSLSTDDDVFAASLDDYCAFFNYQAQVVDPAWQPPAVQPGDPFPQPTMIDNPETKWQFLQRIATKRFMDDVIVAANARAHRTALAAQKVITDEMKARVTVVIDPEP